MDTHDRKAIESVTTPSNVLGSFGNLIFIVVVVELVLMFFLNTYQTSRVKLLNNSIAEQKAILAKPENATVNKQIDEVITGRNALDAVLSQKVKWSKYYASLSAVTPKNVRITAMTISETGVVKIDAVTTSQSALAKTLVAWRDGADGRATPFSSINLINQSFATSADSPKNAVQFSASGVINLGLIR